MECQVQGVQKSICTRNIQPQAKNPKLRLQNESKQKEKRGMSKIKEYAIVKLRRLNAEFVERLTNLSLIMYLSRIDIHSTRCA